MSILIKGIEMPKRCLDCPCFDFEYAECQANVTATRKNGCPLVEVPEPHGRLIDEDRVIDAIHERMRELQESHVFRKKHGDIDLIGVKPYITKIPTIIKAEGKEHE